MSIELEDLLQKRSVAYTTALQEAREFAQQYGHPKVRLSHVALGIFTGDNLGGYLASRILLRKKFELRDVMAKIDVMLAKTGKPTHHTPGFSKKVMKVIRFAHDEMGTLDACQQVGTEHLLRGVIEYAMKGLGGIFTYYGLTTTALDEEIRKVNAHG